MKINWGTAIVIVIASFMAFIMYFFIRGIYDHDITVIENYYEEGLLHDQKNVWRNNALALSPELTFKKNTTGDIEIILPPELAAQKIMAEIKFSRPNNIRLDVEVKENQKGGLDLIMADKFVSGNYRVNAKILAGETTYFWESNFDY